jgi:PAS domain S-box-containing protein
MNTWRVRRSLPALLTTAAFLISYPSLDRLFGSGGANVFVLVPIVTAAWSFGLRGGLVGGIVVVALAGSLSLASGGLALPAGAIQRVMAVVAIGSVVGWLSDMRRKVAMSQSMYEALVENGPGMTYVWSRRRGLQFITSNAENLTGYTAAEWKADSSGLGKRLMEPVDYSAMATALESLNLYDRPMRASFRMRRRDGTLIWVDHHADCIERRADEVIIQGTLIDVTARHEVAAAREMSQAALAESEAKSTFLAATSHELRTPLNSILGFAQLGRQAGFDLDPRTRRYLENIETSGWHLLSLINDLLDLAKVNAGELDVQIGTVDCGDVVREALAQVAPQASIGNVSLHAPSGGHLVKSDPRRLRQIVLNLLSNAVKFTPPGGRVTVAIDRQNDTVLIRVIDTGPGIHRADRERIFEKFKQSADRDARREGTGLGLHLSRRLAQLMGGTIALERAHGTGSVFVLSLPTAGHATLAPGARDFATSDEFVAGPLLAAH